MATPVWKTPSTAFSSFLRVLFSHPRAVAAGIPAAQVRQVPGMGWIPLLSNRVALCQLTLTLRDSNNGNLSALPPHQLKHLSHTKPWQGLMPGPATAPQTCRMEVPASTTHTWGAQRVLCTPVLLLGGVSHQPAWVRPGLAAGGLGQPHCTPFMHLPPLPQPCCQRGWEFFATLEPWPLPTPPGTLETLTLAQAMCHMGSIPSAVSALAQGVTRVMSSLEHVRYPLQIHTHQGWAPQNIP